MRPKHPKEVNRVLNKGCGNVYSSVFKPNSMTFSASSSQWAVWDVFYSGLGFEGYLIPPHPPVQPSPSNVFSLCIQSLSFFFSLMLDSWLFFPSFPVSFSVSAPPPSLEHTLFFIVRDDSNDNNAKNHNSQPGYEKKTEKRETSFRWTNDTDHNNQTKHML